MKKLFVFVASVVAALGVTAAANAGCMATVGAQLDAEAGLAAGHAVGGHDPRAPARRQADAGREAGVRIRNAAGKLFTFKARRPRPSARTAHAWSSRRPAATRSASTTASPSPTARGCTRSSPVLIVAV
jgi:hypothetical protein